ncbi:MAG TPA: mechanosensitive ion channel domain-containing protein [Verrucomicrobiae bacterium]|nr:mechanosensitive ion channel domain-containing protein [Verrucomicrobiae bacterium]
MNAINPPSTSFELATNTVVGRIYRYFSHQESSTLTHILLILAVAILVHVMVKITRHLSEWFIHKSQAQKNPLGFVTQQPKFITLTRLIVSGITFVIYFFALGLVLQEFGVDLTAYLASATVIGLAISFGSQGLVQDVVIGLTLIFSDAMEVGELVEIAGTAVVIGRVEEIGLRFTVLRNFYNQEIFIPNRTIANVSRFPHGGVFAYADIQIPDGVDRPKAVQTVENVARGMWQQFGAIILSEPVLSPVETAEGGGWSFLRVHFKIWPGQGGLIETTFRQQMVRAMKTFEPNYADWQVAVTYRAMTALKK